MESHLSSPIKQSFYPCFNGIRVLTTMNTTLYLNNEYVSILVLMESGFLPVLTIGIAFATIIAHVFIFYYSKNHIIFIHFYVYSLLFRIDLHLCILYISIVLILYIFIFQKSTLGNFLFMR